MQVRHNNHQTKYPDSTGTKYPNSTSRARRHQSLSGSCRLLSSPKIGKQFWRVLAPFVVTRSCFVLSLLFCMLLLPIDSSSTSALTYQSATDVNFTINPTISISLSGDLVIDNLTPGNYSDSNIITVSVATNASQGYYLSATAGTSTTNTNLTHTNGTNVFTSLSTNKSTLSSFDDNYWGYSYSTDNGTNWISGSVGSTNTGYNGLPLDGNDNGATGVTLLDTTNPVAGSSIKFKIGARASNTQASGTYTNTINFYAVTYKEPSTIANTTYLQDVESCPADLISEKTFTLKDKRDEQEYTVAKLKDGKCWMLDNLALDLTNSTVLNNLSSVNTNIDPAKESEILASLKQGNRAAGAQYATAGLTTWDSDAADNVYDIPKVNMDSKDTVPHDNDPMASAALAGNWKVGGYYNYCAASIGSYCYSAGSAPNDEQDGARNIDADICPAGWRMPTGNVNGDLQVLANSVSGATGDLFDNDVTAYRTALRLPSAGYFEGGSPYYQGAYGFLWSSTRKNVTYMQRLDAYVTINKIEPSSHGRSDLGFSVRCLLNT